MKVSHRIAQSFREAYFGKNWTAVNLRKELEQITLKEAVTKIGDHNTILTLVFHLHYYVKGVTKVLEGGLLETKDKYAFDPPAIASESEWRAYVEDLYAEGAHFATLIEKIPDTQLEEFFTEEKYGDYYRNIQGITEHVYYHLGQIVLLKKLITSQ